MTRRTFRLAAVVATTAILVAACGSDDDDSSAATAAPDTAAGTDAPATAAGSADTSAPAETTAGSEPSETTEAAGDGGQSSGWTVSTEDCVDPDRANAPIEGTVTVAASAPLSGGPAAAAFAPVVAGYQAYIDYANEHGLLPDHEIVLNVGDDQYDPALTPGVINGALDSGAHVVSGILGTPANAAVRDLLNEECIPQLNAVTGAPMFGEPAEYPWTLGSALPYNVESAVYAADIARAFPDGATVALFTVNNDVGAVYKDAFAELAGEYSLEIVDEQTIEAPDTAPPAAQLSSIAGNAPDVIMAVPVGAQCPTFMTELANQKAAHPGWEPRVYVSINCASPLILGIAGAAADGLYTSNPTGSVDVANPANADLPGVAEYLAYIESKGLSDTVPTSAAGWITGEVTVEMLRQAAESPEGLTQASIINAARNFEYQPAMVRDGITYKTSGEEDGFLLESAQIAQYDADTKTFTDVGELITEFESS
jgi:ABC-type branched-subunit amino acid transport system substrate-binding protein